MNQQLFTIGHSNQPMDQFLGLLALHHIELLVDIRRFPHSKYVPHFSQNNLAPALEEAGFAYQWMQALGGYRGKSQEPGASPNLGLENEAFRNYADYMQTEPFREAVKELLRFADSRRAVMMCAEGEYWRCHRRILSDYLLAKHIIVQHIFPTGELRPHQATAGAKIDSGRVTYPEEQGSLFV